MDLQIIKLSPALLDDWLAFFDHTAFTDNDEWSGCYCMCYHWNAALNRRKEWNCAAEDGPYNRKCAIDLIKKGKMQGYLAYDGGKVVGWCNANDKNAYDNVNFTLPFGDTSDTQKVKSIVCFCISPEARGKGVASQLLQRVCADAAAEGYAWVEAYPFCRDSYHSYHGPTAMYIKFGFERCGNVEECAIYRKIL